MPNSILVFTTSGVCIAKADVKETVKELNTGRYLLLVISLNKGNAIIIVLVS